MGKSGSPLPLHGGDPQDRCLPEQLRIWNVYRWIRFPIWCRTLGCLTVPAAAGNSKRQIKFISDFKTTALHAIPSYAIRLAEVFQEEGIDPRETTLKTLVIGAEPHTDEQRRKIERMLNVKAYNSFGMTEMNGPGVAFECQEQNGMHFWKIAIW